MSGFSINGVSKPWLRIGRDWSLPAWAPRNRTLLKVPGRPGAIVRESETEVRTFGLPIVIIAGTFQERQQIVEELASWLLSDEPQAWVFDKYPNRTLYAMIDGGLDLAELSEIGQGTLNVICPDPYKYGPSTTFNFLGGAVTLINNGSVPGSPIFEATVLSDLTYLDVFNSTGYMRVGTSVEPGQAPPERMTMVLNDEMIDLTSWAATGLAPTGDTVAGTFESFGAYETKVASYGTGAGWHGPAIKRSIPLAPLTDFQVEIQFKFPSPGSGYYGRTELYLLDDQSVQIGKIIMEKIKGGSTGNTVKVYMGGTTQNKLIISYSGEEGREWNNFNGIIRLIRIGNIWESYVAQVNTVTKVHSARYYKRYTDSSNLYVGNLTQLQLHMAQFGTSLVPDMRISGISVNRFNNVSVDGPYIIARAGDILKFDHKRSELLINGEDAKHLKDFGASFFKLTKGSNTISIEPKEQVNATVTMEEAYL